jgi:hypothetical protein
MKKHKIKSRLKKGGFYSKTIKYLIKNNYLAAWIANFGVVPLFLFEAFLFAPAFFFFLNLLFVVTHVLETIRKLLSRYRCNNSLYNNFKPYFLPIKSLCVKGILLFSTISLFWLPLKAVNAEPISRDLILSRGQSTEISLPNLDKFNVGNKQVLTYQFNNKTKMLLIRGLQLGHSEILVWNKDKSLESYQVFIVSKIQEAKFLHLAEIVSELKLQAKILIPHVKTSGELATIGQYLNYKKILEQNKDVLLDEVTLSSNLKNKIIAEVYAAFFTDYKESVNCQSEFSEISCFYPENESPSENLKKYLIDKYKINLIQKSNQQLKKNYSIKIKLIQLEQLDGEELRLGLEQVSGSLRDFLSTPLDLIVQKNQILLSQKKVKMSTLAEPQTLIRPLSPAEMQIGSDLPFKNISANNIQSIDWKFAGLKIKIAIENYGEMIKINYETELTQPTTDINGVASIGGNKEKSSVIISLKTAVKIFQVSLKTEGKATDQMPFLNSIPILGELFKSKNLQSNFKTISGIIEVIENDE